MRRRDRHADQDEHRDRGPDDLDLGVVHQGHIGHGAARTAVKDDRPDHHPEYDDADPDADPERDHVDAVDLLADAGHPNGKVEETPAGGARIIGIERHGGRCRPGGGEERRDAEPYPGPYSESCAIHRCRAFLARSHFMKVPPRDTLTEPETRCALYFGLEASEGDSLMRPIRRCSRSARPYRSSSVRKLPSSHWRPCDSMVSRLGCSREAGRRSLT